MDSDVEDLAADAESSSASDSSDPDFTDTVLTQLIRRFARRLINTLFYSFESSKQPHFIPPFLVCLLAEADLMIFDLNSQELDGVLD